jgi:hypothetical protein
MVLPTGLQVDSEKDAHVSSRQKFRNKQDEENASTFDLAASERVRPVLEHEAAKSDLDIVDSSCPFAFKWLAGFGRIQWCSRRPRGLIRLCEEASDCQEAFQLFAAESEYPIGLAIVRIDTPP